MYFIFDPIIAFPGPLLYISNTVFSSFYNMKRRKCKLKIFSAIGCIKYANFSYF